MLCIRLPIYEQEADTRWCPRICSLFSANGLLLRRLLSSTAEPWLNAALNINQGVPPATDNERRDLSLRANPSHLSSFIRALPITGHQPVLCSL